MNEQIFLAIIIFFSLLEISILIALLIFYTRLRKSEALLNTLQNNQQSLLARIEMNARLEKEVVATFAQRQAELTNLDEKLEDRIQEIKRLLTQAEGISRSPQFLRELILNGKKKGLSARQISQNSGLSIDEVELILAQNP